jgi:HPt (histidine-containing phosphotransfer) domain-containing protein
MTANVMPGDRQRCLDAGMDDYVSKPVHVDEIDAILRRFLAGQMADDEATAGATGMTPASGSRTVMPVPSTLAAAPVALLVAPALVAPSAAPAGDDDVPMIDAKIADSLKSMQARGTRTSLIADLLTVFRAQAEEVSDHLRAALDASDLTRLREEAHKFKGSCGSIGAARLAARAKVVEFAARENRYEDARAACEQLARLILPGLAALDETYRDALS